MTGGSVGGFLLAAPFRCGRRAAETSPALGSIKRLRYFYPKNSQKKEV